MAMSLQSGSSSNSSSGVGYSYDVFLSFRGKNTRKNFAGHLYNALVQAGIHTFRDDNELPRGEEISQQLLKAIEESRISIVVFSKGYASSTWCLDELAKILECKNTIRQTVLPVFYDIEPSDIRKQKRSFAEAFTVHDVHFKEEMEKVNKWRGALKEASNLSGYSLKDMANGHESTFIQNIVEDVSNKLNRKYFHIANHLVGMDSRVDNMLASLITGSNCVRIVGIHGMPGIGKTTIAKVVFNQLCNRFEGSCFLNKVAEESKQHNGLVKLQEELLCNILKGDSWKIKDKDRGINLINERLRYKRVLVVLDDVEHQEQLDALMVEGCLFGLGSIIIITTRNEHLLNQFEVVIKYPAQLLNADESLRLFSWHAFRDTRPPKDCAELSNRIVDYSGGLPLALKVLGSCLLQKDKRRWESVIDKLRKNPNQDIQKKLRISFDTLEDSKLQKTFLDIACFFIGREKEYVSKALEARCGFDPEDDLGTLIERSLITVNNLGVIKMHDLLRDMGREIISEMYPDRPGKRTRIWLHEDACDVLVKQMGTEAVEGLALDVRASKVAPLCTKSFTEMKHLQLLKINGVHLTGCFKMLPKGLIWLCWHGCPLKSLPSDFELSNLVILDMQYSNIKELWKETKILSKLKILNLSYCENLAKVPNFQGLSNLERLILKNCTSLAEVPQSIGHLKMLVLLNVEGCRRLKILSESICDVKSLEILNISKCSQLEKLPERMGHMESLTELLADGIENEQLLSSIGHLKYVKRVSLRGYSSNQDSPSSTSLVSLISSWLPPRCLNWNLAGWSLLRKLKLASIGLSEGATNCVDFRSLSSLQELDLSGNRFFNLPSGIGCLPKLQQLNVGFCRDLLLISELPSSLKQLYANGCTSMERMRLPIQSNSLTVLSVSKCENLMDIEGLEMNQYIWISTTDCHRLSKNTKRSLFEAFINKKCLYGIIFHHNREEKCSSNGDIPDWFSYHSREKCSLSFHVPPFFQGFIIWIVLESKVPTMNLINVRIKNKSNGIQLAKPSWDFAALFAKCFTSWMTYVRTYEMKMEEYCGEELELYLILRHDGIGVKELGVHMITEEIDYFKALALESECFHAIDNLQGTTYPVDVEERYEIDNQESKAESESERDHGIKHLQGTTSSGDVEEGDEIDSQESESEWDHDINKLQGTISSGDVEEGDEIYSQTGTDMMTPKLYHHLHHPLLGSIAYSTKAQWITYLLKELPGWDIDHIFRRVSRSSIPKSLHTLLRSPENWTLLKDFGCTILHQIAAHTMSRHPLLHDQLLHRIVFEAFINEEKTVHYSGEECDVPDWITYTKSP